MLIGRLDSLWVGCFANGGSGGGRTLLDAVSVTRLRMQGPAKPS